MSALIENNESLVLENEDDILAYTHNHRKEIVKAMTADGVPKDNADISLLLGALKDMDQSALTRKRIKSEEKVANLEAQSAELFSTLLVKGQIKGLYETDVIENRVIPVLGDDMPPLTLVPGETDVGVSVETYDTFMERHLQIIDADYK